MMATLKPSSPQELLALEFARTRPRQTAETLETLDIEERVAAFERFPPAIARSVADRLSPTSLARLAGAMAEEQAVRLLGVIEVYRAALVMARLDPSLRDRLSQRLAPSASREIKDILSYPARSCGSIMDSQTLAFAPRTSLADALQAIRDSGKKNLSNVYVVDDEGRLIGQAKLQDIALGGSEQTIAEVQRPQPFAVKAIEPYEEAVAIFEEKRVPSVPVVDFDNKLIGDIRQDALIEASQREALDDIGSLVGASPDESARSSAWTAVRKRLAWLNINLATAFLAAAVVGIFESTIAQFTALAVLLPVVAGQSGNTGAQALAVTIRGLTLKEVRASDWLKLARKELGAGFINGLAVAIVTGFGVYLWSGSLGLVAVISMAMVISMMIAGVSGAAIPVLLKALKQDPAAASSILLTTVTDVFGFMSFLGLATLFSSWLS